MKIPPITGNKVFHPSFINKQKKTEVKQEDPKPQDLSPDLFIKQTIEKPQLAVFKI